MDDEADGPFSRAPELEDVVGLCAALNGEGARYLLIGGFAVILHGFVRASPFAASQSQSPKAAPPLASGAPWVSVVASVI